MSIISTNISKAAQLLRNEDLVAIPTETVYGLAGNIFSEKAINAIFSTKKRPLFNPLIVHIPSLEHLEKIASDVPDKARALAIAFWPGPLTIVLNKKPHIPKLITAGKETVAIRVPNHPLTLELLNALEFPLAAPSANPFGSISPTSAKHVESYFKNDIQMVLDGGPCQKGIESTIIGFENGYPVIYRLGSISVEEIEVIVGKAKIKNKKELKPDAPGMLARHYAPATTTILTDDLIGEIKNSEGRKIGVLAFQSAPEQYEVEKTIILSKKGSYSEAAKNLYSALHELDKKKLDIIIVEKLPNEGLGASINDRLQRATFAD